jgi:hypothetical protein
MTDLEIMIASSGQVKLIYSEVIELESLGATSIKRVSAVEPTSNGQWMADLSLVGGPLLGPFGTRSKAIETEIAWLREHWLPQANQKSG